MTRHSDHGSYLAFHAGELPPATCDNCGRKFDAEESHREGGEEICPECYQLNKEADDER